MHCPTIVSVVIIIAGLVADPTVAQNNDQVIQEPAKLSGLSERWSDAMSELHVPGMAVVVVQGDTVIFKQLLGVRDTVNELPVTPQTMFYVASCTKTYLATAVMKLVEQKQIDLDEPVVTYLPKFRIADNEATSFITVRDLLSHTKGLDSTPIVFLDAYSGQISEPRYYHWLSQVETRNEPQYTNVHYTLLGRVLESVTGRSWQEVLESEVFRPLGLTRSTASADRMYSDHDFAVPTTMKDDRFVPTRARKTDRTMHAAGGMGTSIDDLSRWIRLHLNDGELEGNPFLRRDTIHEMQTLQAEGQGGAPGIPNLQMKGFGLSWFMADYKNHPTLLHGGGYAGAAAVIMIVPEEKLGVGVVSNATGVMPQLVAFDILDRMLDLEGPDLLPMVKRMTDQFYSQTDNWLDNLGDNPAEGGLSSDLNSYVGNYKHEFWGSIEISLNENQHLRLKIGDLEYQVGSRGQDKIALLKELSPPDEGHFVLELDQVKALVIKFSDYADEISFAKE